MTFTEEQQAFVRETARAVVREMADRLEEGLREQARGAVLDHALHCEAKTAVTDLKTDLAGIRGRAGGVWKAVAVAGSVLAVAISVAVALVKH